MYPVTKPTIPDLGRYVGYVEQANARSWLTNFGPLHEELTERLKAWLGVDNLLLVSNGTLALQVAYRALGITGDVLTSPFSFLATTSSLHWERLRPVFADIDPASFNLDPRVASRAADRNEFGGIVPVHVYGNPCDVHALADLGRSLDVPIVYDAAHAFGSRLGEESLLHWGDAATLSFHATKLFHTIEGGAIVFKDPANLEKARALINFGQHAGTLDPVGINAKLSEYHAAAGLVLLDSIDEIIDRRVERVFEYRRALESWVEFQACHSEGAPNGAYMPIVLSDERRCVDLHKRLAGTGVGTRRYFYPSLNTLGPIDQQRPCPVSEDIATRILCLPLYTELTRADVDHIAEQVKAVLADQLPDAPGA